VSSLSGKLIIREQTSYASEEAVQGTGHVDQAKEQHIKELESLVSEYKSHIRALETEIQELAKRPVLDQGSGLQALREELANEKHALQEAHRSTLLCRLLIPSSWEN
jgi:predicted RNase H-like nuclease (RuvC/YqgF family)